VIYNLRESSFVRRKAFGVKYKTIYDIHLTLSWDFAGDLFGSNYVGLGVVLRLSFFLSEGKREVIQWRDGRLWPL
jgi:hypothetical protein